MPPPQTVTPDFQPPRQLLLIPQQLQPLLAQAKNYVTYLTPLFLSLRVSKASANPTCLFLLHTSVCPRDCEVSLVTLAEARGARERPTSLVPSPISLQSGGVSPGRTVPPTAQGGGCGALTACWDTGLAAFFSQPRSEGQARAASGWGALQRRPEQGAHGAPELGGPPSGRPGPGEARPRRGLGWARLLQGGCLSLG